MDLDADPGGSKKWILRFRNRMGNRIHNTAFNLSLLVLEVSTAPAVLTENLLYLLHVVAVLLLDHRQRLVRDNLRLLDTRKLVSENRQGGNGGYYPRVSYSDPGWIRIQLGQWIRIRTRNQDPDPGGQK
jgi:hypothetical protein